MFKGVMFAYLKLSGSNTLATLYGNGMIPFMTAFMADLKEMASGE